MQFILEIIWLLLPAGVANIMPVLVRKINFLNYQIDGGVLFFGQPLFGKNKTWRGFFFGILTAIIVVLWQRNAYIYSIVAKAVSFFDYTSVNIYLLGFLLGFGALFGDLIKSFFKRRIKIAPGEMWIPFDQIDWVAGAMICLAFMYRFNWLVWLSAFIIYGLLHPLINIVGYWLKIKDTKF